MRALQVTPSELDRRYPYDPSLPARHGWGTLEMLRTVADRTAALGLYELFRANEKRWAVEESWTRYGSTSSGPDGKMRQAGEGR